MNKGYLQLCSLSNYDKYKDSFDKKLFIVRNPMKVESSKYDLIHVPELSPSPELFKTYHSRWKKNIFTEKEQGYLNLIGDNDWWQLYYVQFVEEMSNREDMKMNLDRIHELLSSGTNILLVCFCGSHSRCHRSIIGEYFEELGFEVKYN